MSLSFYCLRRRTNSSENRSREKHGLSKAPVGFRHRDIARGVHPPVGGLDHLPDKLLQVVLCQTKEEGNVLFNDALNTFLFTVIWRQTYG